MNELLKKRKAIIDRMKARLALAEKEDRDLTEAEVADHEKDKGEVSSLDTRIARARELEDSERNAPEPAAVPGQNRQTPAAGAMDAPGNETRERPGYEARRIEIPNGVRRFARLRNFPETREGELQAYRFGTWMKAILSQDERAIQYCRDNGLQLRSQTEGTDTAGGYLVPDEFDNVLVDLRERYGVFRRNARVVPMMAETKRRLVRTGGLTAYFVGELASGTASSKSWNQFSLTARKVMCLSVVSNELAEDAMINIGDDLAGEIAYAFAELEDGCGFIGDGTSTYGGMRGVIDKLGSAGKATAASGSSTNWGAITIANMGAVVGKLPTYAETPSVAWYCSKPFFANVMEALMYAAGGNTRADIQSGNRRTFMGYPVEITQKLPTVADAAEVVCLFGDLRLAADFGDRRQLTLARSMEATVDSINLFEQDAMAIRGTERFDINVHSAGDSSNAGPIVGLLTAA